MRAKDKARIILQKAVKQRSSDIFLFPKSNKYALYLRDNNDIFLLEEFDLEYGQELISYFKYIAQMDIAEHRRPQVGAFETLIDNKKIYLRFSSNGNFANQEGLVIRLIYSTGSNNYFFEEQKMILQNLCQKRGLIITSGPTGSGKTSTMYELARLVGENKVVMTIEDPVEIYEPTFFQTQINISAGIHYLDLMKAALRNRPNILIIGEIRDPETAKVAINAAMSGHLVLATVHAKSSLQTISRLEGLGINQDELYNALTAVSYQRLIKNEALGTPAALFDIAHGNVLKEAIMHKNRSDFVSWEENISILRKENKVSEADFQIYRQG